VIFIGKDLNDLNAHFVTNVVESVGEGSDLIIDLGVNSDWGEIKGRVSRHCEQVGEQYVIYNAYTDESLPVYFKKQFPFLKLIIFFSDDEWRHKNYDRYLALYADAFTIAVRDNVERYLSYGLSNVHYLQWACNPKKFYPVVNDGEIYDVTFIGAAYGKRIDYVRYLISRGVDIKVFGPYWNRYKDLRQYWGGSFVQAGYVEDNKSE